MKISRRKFFTILILSITSLIGTYFTLFGFDRIVLNILRSDLDDMGIPDEHFHQFIQEARVANHWEENSYNWLIKGFIVVYSFLPEWGFPYQNRYNQFREKIVGDFLLSTDFFTRKNNREKVQYLGIYNPYHRPCGNPFSYLYYDSKSLKPNALNLL